MANNLRFNPFPGIRAFNESEEYLFFARENDISESLAMLKQYKFLTIAGALGSGKSSLINAGIVPALYKGDLVSAGSDWKVIRITPGASPLTALASALLNNFGSSDLAVDSRNLESITEASLLRSSQSLTNHLQQQIGESEQNVLFIIDDFHHGYYFESLKNKKTIDDYNHFYSLLADISEQKKSRYYVLIALDSESLPQALQIKALGEQIKKSKVLLRALSREEIKKTVEGPLMLTGVKISSNLLSRIANDINELQMPLSRVQYSIHEVFKHWERNHKPTQEIEIKHYEEIGAANELIERNFEAIVLQLKEQLSETAILNCLACLVKKHNQCIISLRKSVSDLALESGLQEDDLNALIKAFTEKKLFQVSFENKLIYVSFNGAASAVIYDKLLQTITTEEQLFKFENEITEEFNTTSDKNRLFKGEELSVALLWLKERYPKYRKNGNTTFDFMIPLIQESRKRELQANDPKPVKTKWKPIAIVFIFVSLISLGIAGLSAFITYNLNSSNELLSLKYNSVKSDNLIYKAEAIKNTDPTAAFKLAIEALDHNNSQAAMNLINKLYSENIFYSILNKQQGEFKSLAVSPNGKLIVAGTEENRILLFDNNGKSIKTLEAHKRAVNDICFSPNGNYFVTGSADQTAIVWHSNGEALIQLNGHNNSITSVIFSPNGKFVATASLDQTIKIWNLEGKPVFDINAHEKSITKIRFSPDGQYIAGSSFDGTILIHNLSGELKHKLTYDAVISDFDFSPNGQMILSGSFDNTYQLRKLNGEVILNEKAHSDYIRAVQFFADGTKFLTASDDETIKIWNIEGNLLSTLKGHSNYVLDAAILPGTSIIISISKDKTMRSWEIGYDLPFAFKAHESTVTSAAYSPDGTRIASASADKSIKIFNLEGKELRVYSGHMARINTLQYSNDGTKLLSCSNDGTIKLWELNTGAITTFTGHVGPVYTCTFTPDNKYIVSGGNDASIKIWNLNGTVKSEINAHKSAIWSVSVSPDNKTILSGSDDKHALLTDFGGKILQTFAYNKVPVTAVAISHNGLYCAMATLTNEIVLYSTTGTRMQVLTGHTKPVNSLKFSKNDSLILSASEDFTAMLWNLKGDALQTFRGHTGLIWQANFSNDNKTILTAGSDKTITIQKIKPQKQELIAYYRKQEYTIEQKIEFGLTDFEECLASDQTDKLFYAAIHYRNLGENDNLTTNKELWLGNSVALMEKLIKIDPSLANLKEAKACYVAYNKETASNKYEKEIDKMITQILATKPKNEQITEIIWYEILNKEYDAAIIKLNEIIAADSLNYNAYRNLAVALILNNRYSEAEKIYEKFKNVPYNSNYLLREIFIGDLKAFEYEGNEHPDIDKAFEYLKKK
ncbi:MAG TPA: hypothetical protein DCQ31_10485 [Bacteroidales bacterium]|nr:hypothetical protein [Bacteroidales bacterium]